MNALSLTEYKSTITAKMFEVKDTKSLTVDIWPYVQELVNAKIISAEVHENKEIDGIYRNSENTFEHIQIPTTDSNVFTFVIVNLTLGMIKGHFCLDL
jgi:hypothetical protein